MASVLLSCLISIGCRATEYFELPAPSQDRRLALVELDSLGQVASASALTDPGEALKVEVSGAEDARVYVHAFAEEDFAELHRVSREAGLDAPALEKSQRVQPAEGCAPGYPAAREIYELVGTNLSPSDATHGAPLLLSAPWLEESCVPIVEPAAGFLSSLVISSDCDACPASEVQHPTPCRMIVTPAQNSCSSARDSISILRNWRQEFCLESSSTCDTIDSERIRCGTANERCELEFTIQPFSETDRFAVVERVAMGTQPKADLAAIGASVVVASVDFETTRYRCAELDRARLQIFEAATGRLNRELELEECVTVVTPARTSEHFIAVSVTEDDVFHVLEIDLSGQVSQRLRIEPGPVLGLGPNEDAYVLAVWYWPAQNGYVAGFAQVGERGRPGVLAFFPSAEESAPVTFGPRFTIPAGGVPIRILDDGPSGAGLYLMSGGSWTHLTSPYDEVLFQSIDPLRANRTPTPRDFGSVGDGRLWVTGQTSQSAQVLAFDDANTVLATHGESPGDAKTLVPWDGSNQLVLMTGPHGTLVARFDLQDWRFIPGTLVVSPDPVESGSGYGGVVQASDGSLWITFADGTLYRVRRP